MSTFVILVKYKIKMKKFVPDIFFDFLDQLGNSITFYKPGRMIISKNKTSTCDIWVKQQIR